MMEEQIVLRLQNFPDRSVDEQGRLTATFSFDTYQEAVDFVVDVATVAEKMHHHPHIEFDYLNVQISTITHDSGGTLTKKDCMLVEAVDGLFE